MGKVAIGIGIGIGLGSVETVLHITITGQERLIRTRLIRSST